ncbi:MAG: hypothetical protein NVS2B4_14820 [Ramlibacter sp.]
MLVPVLGVELEEPTPELEPLGVDLEELDVPEVEPVELGLDEPVEPPAPIEVPLSVLLELAPDEPAASGPPFPHAARDRAAAATKARTVARVNLEAFMEELLGFVGLEERENGSTRCLKPLYGSRSPRLSARTVEACRTTTGQDERCPASVLSH